MKDKEIRIEKDGIVNVLKVAEAEKSKDKIFWLEWQFYLMLFLYFIFHTVVRVSLLSVTSLMGILHFGLVIWTYQEIWLQDKSFTWKKALKTFLWLATGNVAMLVIALIFRAILGE